ncbi:MAG: zf-HC2 domain-containing protein [Gemmatimonadetes bacterium]|nr:zf-HC2 domain-containing protein [Gemmatimonadota bacterium]
MVDCHSVMKRLWEYLDGELPLEEAQGLREHLAVCARCYPQYQFQLAFLAALARAHAGPAASPRPEFARRLRAALAMVESSPSF